MQADDQAEILTSSGSEDHGGASWIILSGHWFTDKVFDAQDVARIAGSMTSGVVYFVCILAMLSSRLMSSLASGR